MNEPHEVLFWVIATTVIMWLVMLVDSSPDDPV